MNAQLTETETPFKAMTVVSPMCHDGESKDQDRAQWFGKWSVGAVCDGVTSSPMSREAAELAVKAAPILFSGQAVDSLGALADLLFFKRQMALSSDVQLPADTPPAMQDLLAEAARKKLASSHQTTLTAVSLTPREGGIRARVVACGDSAFFAFCPAEGLIATSLSTVKDRVSGGGPAAALGSSDDEPIPFGPGDELIAKVINEGQERPDLFGGMAQARPTGWLVCQPSRCLISSQHSQGQQGEDGHVLLRDGDLLLVPRYLTGRPWARGRERQCHVPFTKNMRHIPRKPVERIHVSLQDRGSATAVLPDHVYTGRWRHTEHHVPWSTHFVLASDGFYSCFADPMELWQWLSRHEAELARPQQQATLMARLHDELHAARSDDDMSFLWIHSSQQGPV